jgi:pimeloyl-ACP methyl ester carboxylesterase
MMRVLLVLFVLLAFWVTANAQSSDTPLAPELSGLGQLHFSVTTSVPRAQRFFDQGLRLLYAFNHAESIRAFREAARLDPKLAMAYWGQAMAFGPNLNVAMSAEHAALALDAIGRARLAAAPASPRERALITALAARYSADPAADRKMLDRAYADAMREVAAAFADDADVLTLYADAVMNVSPWDYWEKNGSAKPLPATAIAALERALAKAPNHAGALHYHIHALEASNEPERAEASADRLAPLMPAAGHMVHMPAHIYLRVGRYQDAAEANERAILADEDYLAQCQAQGLYPITLYPHNLHFLWAAATLEGRGGAAIDAALSTAMKVPHHHAGAVPWTTDFPVTPMLAYARFGRWREALVTPRPPASDPYANGIWHYTRTLAFVARRDFARATAEMTLLKQSLKHEAFSTTLKDLPLLTNLEIASRMAAGELAARRGDGAEAVRLLKEAVAIEDELPYSEPPIWHHPPRQVLGAILLEAGRATEAEQTYREDLRRFRENGWSLFGLMQSLRAQGRGHEAAAVDARFKKAWRRADVTLSSSRIIEDQDALQVGPYRRNIVSLKTGVTLEYVQHGNADGVPMILLHGITDSWRSFEWMLPHLPPTVNAFAVTMRGHGGSGKPAHGFTPADYAADVAAFMDALALDRAVIVGHSMGSAAALRFALDYPARTRALVMLGGTASWQANAVGSELVPAFAALGDPVDHHFAHEFQASTVATDVPHILDVATRESVRVPAYVWREAMAGLQASDMTPRLAELTVPTLIMWGDKETVATRAEQQTLATGIRGARLIVYEGAGHAIHWDQPAAVARDLAAFVESL